MWYIVAAGTFLLLFSFVARRIGMADNPYLRYMVVYPSGLYYAAIILGLFSLAVKDVVKGVTVLIMAIGRLGRRLFAQQSYTDQKPEEDVDNGRRSFLRLAGGGTIGAIAATPLLTSLTTARDYQVRRIPLSFPNLPSELEGFSIAQVSDLHSGIYMSETEMRDIFDIVNGFHPDVTAITGDLVDTNDAEIPPLHNALKHLKADRGVYAVLGNHDHFATGDKVAAATAEAGLTVLRNAHETLQVDGAPLSLIGIDDCSPRRNFADLEKATTGLLPEGFRVMLVHQPRFWPEGKKADVDLTLVGHTHGGQIGIEAMGLKLYPVYLAYDHPMGHFIEDGKQLYVNVGVGMVGAPIRLVRPEIALFELHRGEPQLYTPPTM
jgi:predicted MPP superfamily phosphohydrolase